ncbi:hypothetical protein QR680_018382 [Steinernema hermaphroditum]|uniref:RRM domain-containing protein n=1 Tax=Steinernema hermaphroditum TaxID=289476 RepID=A0AA39HK18_9BILA|nr:hypothetical protein QR680_018357 [Steinernema hermaphroditum]KAK0406123.1 hypothetical protein QR680_018382 [Steinernema hermaphroditum]
MGNPVLVNNDITLTDENGNSSYLTTPNGCFEIVPGRVFIGGLPHDASELELHSLFSEHGNVRHVKIMRYPLNGRSKGFGFVTFDSDEEAQLVRGMKLKFRDGFLNINVAMRRVSPQVPPGFVPQFVAPQAVMIQSPDGQPMWSAPYPRFVMPQVAVPQMQMQLTPIWNDFGHQFT